MRKLFALSLVFAAAAVSACRGSGDDTSATPDSSGSNVDPNDTTIQQIQDPAMATGTAVKLKGVVVTAVDNYGGKKGDIWVEEPGGGPFSGIHVFGAPLDQVAALTVGDVVDIDGAQKDDFHYNGNMGSGGFPDGYAITELKPVTGGVMTVTKSGGNTPITPDVVDAAAIGQIADQTARDAEWEKWEGVLIKVSTVNATTSDKCVGSACNDSTLHSFKITGDIVVESALSAMPTTAASLGDCFASVTGVVDYFFDYQLLPRTTDEIVTGGTGCSSSVTHATIEQVRTSAATGIVSLDDVYVSAVSFNKKNFWVSQSLTAAGNQGVYVMRCAGSSCNTTAALDAAVVPGGKVTVLGKAIEFNNNNAANGAVTQITNPTVTVTAAPTAQVAPVTGQSVSNLLAAGTGEPYEGVLVTLTNVKVNTIGTSTNFYVSDLTYYPQSNMAGVPFKSDDDIYRFVTADMSACYASITGIWTYTPFDMRYQFLPTAVGTGTGTCQ